MNKIPARLHVILARKGDNALVFRRGPSSKVALFNWNRATDAFTLGQWLHGRIYEYRCDLSPDGKYLLYFASKQSNVNPVEARLEEYVNAEISPDTIDWTRDDAVAAFETYFKKRQQISDQLRKKHANELNALRNSPDYTDRTWTAISRAPYLKALDVWFNGSCWNGGGWFIDDTHIWLNCPHLLRGAHFHHTKSGKFTELSEAPDPSLITENGGECPGIYLPRLKRDGWVAGEENGTYAVFTKTLPHNLTLRKHFYYGKAPSPGYGVYWEEHALYSGNEKQIDGTAWRWADYDSTRQRILFAENGRLYACSVRTAQIQPPVELYNFNDIPYAPCPAPY